jgi:hypothetical protein
VHRVLSMVLAYAVKDGGLALNPADAMDAARTAALADVYPLCTTWGGGRIETPHQIGAG